MNLVCVQYSHIVIASKASKLSHSDGRISFRLGQVFQVMRPVLVAQVAQSVLLCLTLQSRSKHLKSKSTTIRSCTALARFDYWLSRDLVVFRCIIVADLLQTDGWAHQTECASVATVMLAHCPPIIVYCNSTSGPLLTTILGIKCLVTYLNIVTLLVTRWWIVAIVICRFCSLPTLPTFPPFNDSTTCGLGTW